MKINGIVYKFLVTEACDYQDIDSYISDCGLSSIWEDDEIADIPQERIDMLADIWVAVHTSVAEMCDKAGVSRRKVAERFCIPYRTMESWCSQKNPIPCPIYTKLMLGRLLGVLKLPDVE